MSQSSDAFVVPAGLVLEQDERGLSIEHEGDIVLHGTLGQRLRRVHSNNGSVTLHLDADLEELAAPRGDVTVHGDLRTCTVRGRQIHISGACEAEGIYGSAVRIDGDVDAGVVSAQEGGVFIGGAARVRSEIESDGGDVAITGSARAGGIAATAGRIAVGGPVQATELTAGLSLRLPAGVRARTVHCDGEVDLQGDRVEVERVYGDTVNIRSATALVRSVQAERSIRVGPGHVESDVFIAPTVALDPSTEGRITGIDSKNELGPSRVRGCLRLEELAWYLGDVEAFLAERGLRRLPEDAVAAPIPDMPPAQASLDAAAQAPRIQAPVAPQPAAAAAAPPVIAPLPRPQAPVVTPTPAVAQAPEVAPEPVAAPEAAPAVLAAEATEDRPSADAPIEALPGLAEPEETADLGEAATAAALSLSVLAAGAAAIDAPAPAPEPVVAAPEPEPAPVVAAPEPAPAPVVAAPEPEPAPAVAAPGPSAEEAALRALIGETRSAVVEPPPCPARRWSPMSPKISSTSTPTPWAPHPSRARPPAWTPHPLQRLPQRPQRQRR